MKTLRSIGIFSLLVIECYGQNGAISLAAPVFSLQGGWYNSDMIELALSTDENDAVILYTLDGSEPLPSRIDGEVWSYKNQFSALPGDPIGPLLFDTMITYAYESPLQISDRSNEPDRISQKSSTGDFAPTYFPAAPSFKGTMVRARVYIPTSGELGPIESHTYFFSEDGASKYDIPVFSIGLDEARLFDYEDGIHNAGIRHDQFRLSNPNASVFPASAFNFFKRGFEAEAVVSLSMFVPNQVEPALHRTAGMRIHGGFSRRLPRKSLRFYARTEYGENTFNYPLIPVQDEATYRRFILSNTGTDWDNANMRDIVIQRIFEPLGLPTQKSSPAVTFINGEYYGVNPIKERPDKHYFESKFGILESNLDLWNGAELQEGTPAFRDFTTQVANQVNMTTTSDFEAFSALVNTETMADAFIAGIYAYNTDWLPNNVLLYRDQTPNPALQNDTRLRFALVDFDRGWAGRFGGGSIGDNFLEEILIGDTVKYHGDVVNWFRKSLTNEGFKNYFISRFADVMNTALQPERCNQIISAYKNEIAPYMPEMILRWSSPPSVAYWEAQVDTLMQFSDQRSAFQREHLMDVFELPGTIDLVVDVSEPEHGFVKVNTINILAETAGISDTPYPWEGVYFKEVPIRLEAIPAPGYAFAGWEGASTDLSPTLSASYSADSLYFKAIFEPFTPTTFIHPLAETDFHFTYWSPESPAGSFPVAMTFHWSSDPSNPGYNVVADATGTYDCGYNLISRPRINGLGEDGFSFISTGNPQFDNCSNGSAAVNRFVGSASIALSTMGVNEAYMSWVCRLVNTGERQFAVRLQYRIGNTGPYSEIEAQTTFSSLGKSAGQAESFNIQLPEELLQVEELHLRFIYYQESGVSGNRPEIAVDDIFIGSELPQIPLLSCDPTHLEVLTTDQANPNNSQQYELSGASLEPPAGVIQILIPEPFEASVDGENYHNTLSLPYNEGQLQQMVNVRISSSGPPGMHGPLPMLHIGGGAPPLQISLKGGVPFPVNLEAGDIQIIGYRSSGNDGISFVNWVALPPQTVIIFTDNAYDGNALLDNENVIYWQSPNVTLPAGRAVNLEEPSVTNFMGATDGTILSGSFDGLSQNGDKVFALQGLPITPHWLYGISYMNDWLSNGPVNNATSYLPEQLQADDFNNVMIAKNAEYHGPRQGLSALSAYPELIRMPELWRTAPDGSLFGSFNDTSFTAGIPNSIIIDFEGPNETKDSYTQGIVNLSGRNWSLTEALIGTNELDLINGQRSGRLRGFETSEMRLVSFINQGIGEISFLHRKFDADPDVLLIVEKNVQGSSEWTPLGEPFAPGNGLEIWQTEVAESSPSRFRIRTIDGDLSTERRANIDDITVTAFGSNIFGIITANPGAVAGLSYNFQAGPSEPQLVLISAAHLQPAAGFLSIAVPEPFEISTDGTNWSNSLSMAYTAGGAQIAANELWIRLQSGLNPGNYMAQIAINAGTTNRNVAIFGQVVNTLSAGSNKTDRGLTLYPNPSAGHTHLLLQNADSQIKQVKLLSSDGKVVQPEITPIKANLILLNTQGLANGIYLVMVTDHKGNAFTERFVKLP